MNSGIDSEKKIVIKDQLNWFQKFVRKFEKCENLIPKSFRVPFRYYAQKFLGALEPEMKFLSELSGARRIVLDIGANKGIYAYALSKVADKVICFEPIPQCAEYIKNFESNKIEVLNIALSDTMGKLEFYIPILNGRLTLTRASLAKPELPFESIFVDIKTLDSFDFSNIDFIKMDVEGFESNVIRGGLETLRKNMPNLLIEIDLRRNSKETFLWIFNTLSKLGYMSYIVESGVIRECPDPLTKALSNYNFIFKRADV